MPDLGPRAISLSDYNSLLFAGVAAVISAVIVAFLVRDYFVGRRRARRFYQKRKPAEPRERAAE